VIGKGTSQALRSGAARVAGSPTFLTDLVLGNPAASLPSAPASGERRVTAPEFAVEWLGTDAGRRALVAEQVSPDLGAHRSIRL
jgi:hypothetical protein